MDLGSHKPGPIPGGKATSSSLCDGYSLTDDHHFDACVDSGALYMLMLKRIYHLLSLADVGQCEETSVILIGASSKYILTYGFTCTGF